MADPAIEDYLRARRSARPALSADGLALLVIDMQIYQTRPSAMSRMIDLAAPDVTRYYFDRLKTTVEPNIAALLTRCRARSVPVFFTRYASQRPDGSDLTPSMQQVNALARQLVGGPVIPESTDSMADILPGLTPLHGDCEVIKACSGAFTNTHLAAPLSERGVTQILVVGVVTNLCVESTARVAADLGLRVFVVEDACAAFSAGTHQSALTSIEMAFGSVISTEEALAALA